MKYSSIINLVFFLLIYKTLISIFIPNVFINVVVFLLLLSLVLSILLSNHKYSYLTLYSLFIIFIISIFLIISIFIKKNNIMLASISYVQLLFPYLCILIFSSVKHITINNVFNKVYKYIFVLFPFALIELFMPSDIKYNLVSRVLSLKFGSDINAHALYVREINIDFFRLVSLTFEPLTFSFLSALFIMMFLVSKQKKVIKLFFFQLINLLTFGKAAIISVILGYFANILKKYFLILIVFVIVLVFYQVFKHIELIYEIFRSMGNHLMGLYFGIHNTFNVPFTGHGLGSAGYLTYMKAKKIGILYNIYDKTYPAGISNGNESTVGILVYQFGFIIASLYLLPFLYFLKELNKSREYLFFGFSIGFILSLFLSESPLNLAIMGIYIMVTLYLLKRHDIMLSIHKIKRFKLCLKYH